jgi:hypothetical protein
MQEGEWVQYIADGIPYYHNTRTGERARLG